MARAAPETVSQATPQAESFSVLYLVWGEDVVDNGIIHNQVFEQLKLIKELEPGVKISLLAGLPYSRNRLKSPRSYRRGLARLKAELETSLIQAWFVDLPVVPRFFYSRIFTLPLFYIGHLLLVRRLVNEHSVDIVHCRSYHAANLIRWAGRLLGVSCKMVFDPRSLFVDEGLLFGAFREGSLHHKLWQGAERALLEEADRVVSVSDTLGQVLKERSPNARIVTIPTSTNTRIFKRSSDREARRHALGVPPGRKVLVYLGNLEAKGWYSPKVLADVYKVFRASFGDTSLLVVTRADKKGLIQTLVACGLLEGEILVSKGERPEEVADLLQSADYSVIPYGKVTTEVERRIAYTVIASKTGEYLCSGLPVIVNEAVGAASRLITSHRVGCTFRLGEESELRGCLRELSENYQQVSRQCADLGFAYFDARAHARQYLSIYHEILGRRLKSPALNGALDQASIQP